MQKASHSLAGSSWVPAPPHPRNNSCPLSCGVSSVCLPAPQALSEADSQRTDILQRPVRTRNGLRVGLPAPRGRSPCSTPQGPVSTTTAAPVLASTTWSSSSHETMTTLDVPTAFPGSWHLPGFHSIPEPSPLPRTVLTLACVGILAAPHFSSSNTHPLNLHQTIPKSQYRVTSSAQATAGPLLLQKDPH